MRGLFTSVLLFLCAAAGAATAPDFPALNVWKNALLTGNGTDFRSLYSVNPPARFAEGNNQAQDISKEIDFWQQVKQSGAQDLTLNLTNNEAQQGLHIVGFEASYRIKTRVGLRTRYVIAKQAWMQQGDNWRIVIATHSDVLKMPQPTHLNPNLYRKGVDAKAEVKEAIAQATREHKRILLIFGANWCIDCHVLEFALHHSDAAPIAERAYVIVHVDIGEGELNPDLVAKYGIPAKHGVPALAVLASDGTILYSDTHREFQSARSMDPEDLISFLNKWKLKA
jgi:thioredoxin 1